MMANRSRVVNWTCTALLAALLFGLLGQAAIADDEKFNYDEAKVHAYSLPNPLVLQTGVAVTTPEQWRHARRFELLELFQSQVYGRRLADPPQLKFHVVESVPESLKGIGKRKEIRVELISGPEPVDILKFTLIVPSGAKGPVPAFVGMHLFDTAAVKPVPGKALTEDVGVALPGDKLLDVILARGYAVATLNANDFCPDDKEKFREGTLNVLLPGRTGFPGAEEPGAISTWAWGLSRALDYLESDREIDAKHVAVIGHSRMGKTALWAGAQDERFALVISNDSGCGGAALSRRNFGETVARINTAFPHWFCGNFKQYDHHEERLPVDQHELVALIVPRPAYVASAVDDGWADPRGEFLAAFGAEPVYRLFGLKGLGTSELPAINQSIGDSIGYHIRAGKHALTDFDWLKYLDFADRHFGRKAETAK